MYKYIKNTALMCVLALAFSVGALAAVTDHELYGDAETVSPGHNSPTAVQLTSVGTSFSGIDFTTIDGITFADLDTLKTDYFFTTGSCAVGSPRFQINVLDPITNTTKNIFAYIGDFPNYTNCMQNVWVNSGDLLEEGKYVDTSQIGGTFYDTYANALATYGAYEVTGIQLVADGGFSLEQSLKVDNVMINNTTEMFESVSTCKNGGWQTYTEFPGPFRNQGQCVSYFARGSHNTVAPE
jgi:hypothetical protein